MTDYRMKSWCIINVISCEGLVLFCGCVLSLCRVNSVLISDLATSPVGLAAPAPDRTETLYQIRGRWMAVSTPETNVFISARHTLPHALTPIFAYDCTMYGICTLHTTNRNFLAPISHHLLCIIYSSLFIHTNFKSSYVIF